MIPPMQGRRHFSIPEWQELAVGPAGVTESEASRLHALAVVSARRLSLPDTAVLARGHQSLQAGQVCGILVADGVTVEILPKVGHDDREARAALIRMLSVAYDLKIADGDLTAVESQSRDLLDLLISCFARRLADALRPGLARRYEPQRDDLAFLRGRLDIKSQFARRPVAATRLDCRFDELDENMPLNRVFKSCLLHLVPLARTASTHRRLAELLSRFEHVAPSRQPLAERVTWDRMTDRFVPIWELARLLLGSQWQTTSAGHALGVSLLFAMNDLFEAYVGRRLRAALVGHDVRLQDNRHHLLSHGAFRMIPDIVVKTPSGPVILDTKWKQLDPSERDALGVEQADLYQLAAYGHAYNRDGAPQLSLIYPHASGLGKEGCQQRWSIDGSDLPLNIWTIDIGTRKSMEDWRQLAHRMIGIHS